MLLFLRTKLLFGCLNHVLPFRTPIKLGIEYSILDRAAGAHAENKPSLKQISHRETHVLIVGPERAGIGTFAVNLKSWEEVEDGHYAIVGSPSTVLEKLEGDLERLGTGNLLGLFQLGTLPADLTRRNMELFAHEVMPKLRERFPEGQPMLQANEEVA